jgi:hypothetical protein
MAESFVNAGYQRPLRLIALNSHAPALNILNTGLNRLTEPVEALNQHLKC